MNKFVWKIENLSYLKGEPFLSPKFTPKSVHQLSITQGHSEIFARVPTFTSSYSSTTCSISFLDSYGTPQIYEEQASPAPNKSVRWIFPNEIKYLPNNTLRVECCMWNSSVRFPPISTSRFAFTRVEPNTQVVRKIFHPRISGFRAMYSYSPFVINETIWSEQSLNIKINFPDFGQADVCLSTISWFGFHAKVKVFALDTTGKMIEFGNHDALFTSTERSSTFKLKASKAMFLRYENKFLPSDTLSLTITCTLSGHFATDSIVEECNIFSNSPTNNAPAVAEVPKTEAGGTETDSDEPEPRREIETDPPNTIVQTLQDILKEGYLSDFHLKVGERTFPVHKSILGGRSKVFKSMFASEMKETQDNCVDIKDVDAGTLQRMLQFIYSDRIDEDLDWADASSLYAAADFYALEPLKQGCSEILKDHLRTTSALGVLYMADLHQDRQLKSAALDFISLNDKDIIGTEDWIKFEKDNGNLALETFRELYSRKMNG